MYLLKKMRSLNKSIGALLIIAILAPLFYFPLPKKAEAQWFTFDVPNTVVGAISSVTDVWTVAKDAGLDSLAWIAADMVIKKITAQTVNWINGGFKGNPAFITDPNQFFMNVGDSMASRVLSETSLSKLCTPFKAQIRIALVKNYLAETDPSQGGVCTLGMIENNFENFTNNFSSGGWDAFFNVTQNNQNNPYGAYLNTKNQLAIEIAGAGEVYNKQLDWGKGFLSYQKCKPGTEQKPVGATDGNGRLSTATTGGECLEIPRTITSPITGLPQQDPNWQCTKFAPIKEEVVDSGLAVGDCSPADKETVTPGSVINDQLGKVFGSGIDKLGVADEINEIFSALIGQLTNALVGGIGNGLRGLTQKTATSPRTFYDQISPGSPESDAEYSDQKGSVESGVDSVTQKINEAATNAQNSGQGIAGVQDTPVLSLKGDSPMDIKTGTAFADPGATALDPATSDLILYDTTGVVDVNTPGSYTITYTAVNSSGSASVNRIVNVVP